MDFSALKTSIEAAARQAFSEMVEAHRDEGIYAFALYSDDGAMTVCPSTNTLEHLKKADPEDLSYFKFEPAEWKYEGQGADALFGPISTQCREEVLENEDDEAWFVDFRDGLFGACLEVLEKLKNEHFFEKVAGHPVFLIFTVSDSDTPSRELKRIVERLNDNEYRDEYLQWMESWH